jgi:putative ABC transport system permease protein
MTALLASLGAAGAALSAAGVFGVVAYLMGRRRREIALRLALGAAPRDIVRGVVREGARVGALGVAIGLVGALAAAGSLRALLFGVAPYDPLTMTLVAVVLLGVTSAAAWWPARRAAAVDPALVLRED